jgi:hypothetical protein
LTVVFLGAFGLLLALPAGIALAGDVTFAEANGQLGLEAAQSETPVSEAPRFAAEGGQETPWLETTIYLLVASLVFAGYAFAARKVSWLRPRRHRKS